MKTLDRYILSETLRPFAVTLLLALLILLVERLLRLLDLALGTEGPLRVLVQMLTYLVPHYIGLALPIGFFLGVLLGFRRLHRDSEMDALLGAGVSLQRLLQPTLAVALFVVAVSAVTLGYLQPHSRYAYQSMVHAAGTAAIQALLKPGTFASINGKTFLAEEISEDRRHFRQVFLYSETEDGTWTAITAETGFLAPGAGGQPPTVVLQDGILLRGNAETGIASEPDRLDERGALRFDSLRTGIGDESVAGFRLRGGHEREMTLTELWRLQGAPTQDVGAADIVAEFHSRMVRVLSVLALPFLAVPLALSTGNRSRGNLLGVAIGVVVLISYHEALNFGKNLVESEEIGAFAGLWLPFLLFLAVSVAAFTAMARRGSLANALASPTRRAPALDTAVPRPTAEEEARRCAS